MNIHTEISAIEYSDKYSFSCTSKGTFEECKEIKDKIFTEAPEKISIKSFNIVFHQSTDASQDNIDVSLLLKPEEFEKLKKMINYEF